MAPAAAPPHRGLPAGQAEPGRWPDRQGAGRLASPGAAASRLGRGYGRGGWEAAPAGGGSGAASSRGWPGLAQRPQRKRAGPGAREAPAATEAASFPSSAARPRAGPPPLSGSAVRRGSAGLAPTTAPLRLRRAEAAGGGSPPHRLVPASRGPARPSHLQRALGTARRVRRRSEPHSGAPRAGRRRRHRLSSRHSAPGPPTRARSSGGSARPLGPALTARSPSAARSMRAARAAALVRRGGAGGCVSPDLPGACPRRTSPLAAFYADPPSSGPSRDTTHGGLARTSVGGSSRGRCREEAFGLGTIFNVFLLHVA